MKLEIESRHSDYGKDAGGYSVLRFDGEWIGRVEDRAAALKLIEYVKKLEATARITDEALAKRDKDAFDAGFKAGTEYGGQ